MVTPNDISNKWARRLSQSTDDIRKGVDSVTEAPSARAIRKKEKFVQELMRAIQDGSWEKALGAYSLEAWKRDMKERGINRIASGAESAKADFEAFLNEFLPYAQDVANRASQMPDLTTEDRINKAVFVMRELAKFKRK